MSILTTTATAQPGHLTGQAQPVTTGPAWIATDEFLTILKGLWEGSILPRVGDFVKSRLAPTKVGFVVSTGPVRGTTLKIYHVQLANGTIVPIGAEDLIFLAPFEWGWEEEPAPSAQAEAEAEAETEREGPSHQN